MFVKGEPSCGWRGKAVGTAFWQAGRIGSVFPPLGGVGYNDRMVNVSSRRWFVPTPGRLLPVLLAVEGLLWLSERFQWFAFNQHKGYAVLIAVASVAAFLLLVFLWFLAALVFRWRFQFSLLSMLVMPLVVVIVFGWLATEMKAARQQREVVEEFKKAGGMVSYDYQFDASGRFAPAPNRQGHPGCASWWGTTCSGT